MIQFQKNHGLDADGTVGKNTVDALNNAMPPDNVQQSEPASPPQTYVTLQGDTLWGLAKRFLGSGQKYTQIMTANNLKTNVLQPGMNLTIPCY